jgi:hypothetical protein
MRDIHTERSDNFCCLHFLYSKYLQNWRLPRFSMIGRWIGFPCTSLISDACLPKFV